MKTRVDCIREKDPYFPYSLPSYDKVTFIRPLGEWIINDKIYFRLGCACRPGKKAISYLAEIKDGQIRTFELSQTEKDYCCYIVIDGVEVRDFSAPAPISFFESYPRVSLKSEYAKNNGLKKNEELILIHSYHKDWVLCRRLNGVYKNLWTGYMADKQLSLL